jgi:hypothetical protein
MRELALADHGIRGGAVILAAGVVLTLGGFVVAGALDHLMFILAGVAGMFLAVGGGLVALDSARERPEARVIR